MLPLVAFYASAGGQKDRPFPAVLAANRCVHLNVAMVIGGGKAYSLRVGASMRREKRCNTLARSTLFNVSRGEIKPAAIEHHAAPRNHDRSTSNMPSHMEPPSTHRQFSFELTTSLPISVEKAWQHASTWADLNREFWPLARMTYPADRPRLTLESIPLGQRAFRSWILLLGCVPIDFDDLTLVALEPGRGFHEISRLSTMEVWEHRRTITPTPHGCQIKDEVSGVPRWSWIGPFSAWISMRVFKHRHRRLRRLFGGSTAQQATGDAPQPTGSVPC